MADSTDSLLVPQADLDDNLADLAERLARIEDLLATLTSRGAQSPGGPDTGRRIDPA